MLYEEFNTELIDRIDPRSRDCILSRYSRSTSHHRYYASKFSAITTEFLRAKHSISTVQFIAHLYLESTEFVLSGQAKEISDKFLSSALDRVDGIHFRTFLREKIGWDNVEEVMRHEVNLCRQISNGDKFASELYPTLSIITNMVDNLIADSRESMEQDAISDSDAAERRQYIASVIMVNRQAHPIGYEERCERLVVSAKDIKSHKQAKALTDYSHEHAAIILEMSESDFRSMFSTNVTPSLLNYFYAKTNFRDRSLRDRNFLPNNIDSPSLIAANNGPEVISGNKKFDEDKVKSIVRKEQDLKVINFHDFKNKR